jgi:hypothetical protein
MIRSQGIRDGDPRKVKNEKGIEDGNFQRIGGSMTRIAVE